MFSLPAEKWWENYWKLKIIIHRKDGQQVVSVSADFYFIEFRSRNRPPKN